MGGVGSGSKPKDARARRAALTLLRLGLVSPAELVEHIGLDRSTVHRWPIVAEVDWKRARQQRVSQLWSKEVSRGSDELG